MIWRSKSAAIETAMQPRLPNWRAGGQQAGSRVGSHRRTAPESDTPDSPGVWLRANQTPNWTLTLVLAAVFALILGGPQRSPALLAQATTSVAVR